MANNPVLGTLLENLDYIEIIFKETYDVFKNDRQNTGDSKEYTIQEFLECYLTNDFKIKKGCIYSKTSYSNNIDCVILAPNHPILTTPKRSIILAEGVYAAVEVKPDIANKVEFERSLQQVKSVKNLNRKIFSPDLSRLMKTPPLPEFKKKIPSIIFSAKSLSPAETYNFIYSKLEANELTIYDLPDMIVTLDNGLFVYSPIISTTLFGNFFLSQNKHFTENTLLHFETNKSETLALFLWHLFTVPSPVMLNAESLLIDYLSELNNIKIRGYTFEKEIVTRNASQGLNDTLKERLLQIIRDGNLNQS